jgi:hypothetical protein
MADAIVLFVVAGMVIITPIWVSSTSMEGAEASPEVPARARVGIPFEISVNETAQVEGADIDVTFLNVTEDSRCPSDVVCIWAGQVTVVVGLSQNGTDLGRFNLTLGAGNSSMASQEVGSHTITLVGVQPYPISSQPTLPSEYVATLVLSGEGGPAMARSVLVKAVGNSTEGPAITGFIASWSVDLQTGVAIVVMRNDGMSLSRVVAGFVPAAAECADAEMAECIDGEITSVSGDARIIQGDAIHFETDNDTKVVVTLGSDEYELEIRKFKEVSKVIVT